MGSGVQCIYATKELMSEPKKDTRFKKGEVHNPKGRPKGSKNKLTERFWSDVLKDWEQHGAFALSDCRESDPVAYCKIVASILPKNIELDVNTNVFVDVWQRLSDGRVTEAIDGEFKEIATIEHDTRAEPALPTPNRGLTAPRGSSSHEERLVADVRARRRREMLGE